MENAEVKMSSYKYINYEQDVICLAYREKNKRESMHFEGHAIAFEYHFKNASDIYIKR